MASSSEQTVASIIMISGGSTFGILGTLLSSLSSLYIIKHISTSGCSAVEYLPKLLNSSSNVKETCDEESNDSTAKSILSKLKIDFKSYMWMSAFLFTGVCSKKLGTFLSSPITIGYVEKLLYRKS